MLYADGWFASQQCFFPAMCVHFPAISGLREILEIAGKVIELREKLSWNDQNCGKIGTNCGKIKPWIFIFPQFKIAGEKNTALSPAARELFRTPPELQSESQRGFDGFGMDTCILTYTHK